MTPVPLRPVTICTKSQLRLRNFDSTLILQGSFIGRSSHYLSVLMPIMGFSGPRMQVFVQMVSEKRIVLIWIHSET